MSESPGDFKSECLGGFVGIGTLDITWDLGPTTGLSSAKVSAMLADGAARAEALAKDTGNTRAAAASGAVMLKAQYPRYVGLRVR